MYHRPEVAKPPRNLGNRKSQTSPKGEETHEIFYFCQTTGEISNLRKENLCFKKCERQIFKQKEYDTEQNLDLQKEMKMIRKVKIG